MTRSARSSQRPRCGAFAIALAIAAIPALPARAGEPGSDSYPSRAIKIVVPNPPGGSIDLVARAIADRMAQVLGQPVVVEDKNGASGLIGAKFVLASPADGYCLLASSSSTNTIMPHVVPNAGMDGVRDFAPIANMAWTTKAIVVRMVPGTHAARHAGVDLAAAFRSAVRGEPWTGSSDVSEDSPRALALFPQEWLRDRHSAHLALGPSDAPWDDPSLFAAMLGARA